MWHICISKRLPQAILDLLVHYSSSQVDAKLSSSDDFEGIDRLEHWEGSGAQQVPEVVMQQLESPELVVVRADHHSTSLHNVLNAISEKTMGIFFKKKHNINFSIPLTYRRFCTKSM